MTSTHIPPTFRTVALVAALVVATAACGGSDSSSNAGNTSPAATEAAGSDTTAAAETTAPETTAAAGPEPTADALTVESGFSSGLSSLGSRFNSAGAVVTNTSDRTACGVQVQFSILDAKGAEIDNRTESIAIAAGGAKVDVAASGLGGGKPDEPASLEVKVLSVDSFSTDGTCTTSSTVTKGIALETSDVAIADDKKYITGQLSNPSDTAAERAALDCVLRSADGAIVGGETGVVRDAVAPGTPTPFKARMVWTPPTAAAAECSAVA